MSYIPPSYKKAHSNSEFKEPKSYVPKTQYPIEIDISGMYYMEPIHYQMINTQRYKPKKIHIDNRYIKNALPSRYGRFIYTGRGFFKVVLPPNSSLYTPELLISLHKPLPHIESLDTYQIWSYYETSTNKFLTEWNITKDTIEPVQKARLDGYIAPKSVCPYRSSCTTTPCNQSDRKQVYCPTLYTYQTFFEDISDEEYDPF